MTIFRSNGTADADAPERLRFERFIRREGGTRRGPWGIRAFGQPSNRRGHLIERLEKRSKGMPGNYRESIVGSALIALLGVGVLFF
jgi:hypothetical protein